MAAEQVHFMYTGGGREVIPDDATHVTIHHSITVIEAELFYGHPNIVELISHEGVIRIEVRAFNNCPRLTRVIIPGVKIIGNYCFCDCEALIFIDCPKLETIGKRAFAYCSSLSNINLQSVTLVESDAFAYSALSDVEFGSNLKALWGEAFKECSSLERITLPLSLYRMYDGLDLRDSVFTACSKLTHVDLVERAILHDTINALLMDEWRDDMNSEIAAINQSLPVANPGSVNGGFVTSKGEKARVIEEWIERVLGKIIDYKAQHRRILEEATSTLQLALPCDIVLNNIVSFVELPPHTFDGEDDDIDESYCSSVSGDSNEEDDEENDYMDESQYSSDSIDSCEDDSQEDDYSDGSPCYSSDSDGNDEEYGNDEEDGHEDDPYCSSDSDGMEIE